MSETVDNRVTRPAPAWNGRDEEESVSAVDIAALSPLACLAVVPLRNTHALLAGILTVGWQPVVRENYAIDIPNCRLRSWGATYRSHRHRGSVGWEDRHVSNGIRTSQRTARLHQGTLALEKKRP